MGTRRPRLTDAQLKRISTLCEQGLTAPNIAEQLGVPYRMVWRALDRLALTPTPATGPGGRVRPAPAESTVSAEQQHLLARFTASGVSVEDLAQRLGVEWRQLSRELRGAATMTPARLARLAKLLQKLPA